MKIKITNEGIVELHNGLMNVGNLTGVKFSYAVAKNINILKGEVESFRKAAMPTEIFQTYEKERFENASKHAEKGSDGKALKEVIDGIERFVIKNKEEFEKDYKAIREKHKEAIQKREVQLKEMDEIMDEEVEIEVFAIPVSYIPEEITAEQMSAILPVIKE
jgi:hypothetical protein